jgi:hypothetical protein
MPEQVDFMFGRVSPTERRPGFCVSCCAASMRRGGLCFLLELSGNKVIRTDRATELQAWERCITGITEAARDGVCDKCGGAGPPAMRRRKP